MRRLKINLTDLAEAFEGFSEEATHYLDLETGQVVFLSDEARRGVEDFEEESASEDEDLAPLGVPDWTND